MTTISFSFSREYFIERNCSKGLGSRAFSHDDGWLVPQKHLKPYYHPTKHNANNLP